MERYTLWADEIVLKSSDNLDELTELYNQYDTDDSPYSGNMYIMDNLTNKVIYG